MTARKRSGRRNTPKAPKTSSRLTKAKERASDDPAEALSVSSGRTRVVDEEPVIALRPSADRAPVARERVLSTALALANAIKEAQENDSQMREVFGSLRRVSEAILVTVLAGQQSGNDLINLRRLATDAQAILGAHSEFADPEIVHADALDPLGKRLTNAARDALRSAGIELGRVARSARVPIARLRAELSRPDDPVVVGDRSDGIALVILTALTSDDTLGSMLPDFPVKIEEQVMTLTRLSRAIRVLERADGLSPTNVATVVALVYGFTNERLKNFPGDT